MAAVRNLIVRGGADFSGLRRGMQQLRESTRQMQSNFQSATNSMSKAANQVSRVIRTAFAVVGVTSMAALGKQAIDTASDMQEVQNVVDTAFGRMSDSAETFAKKARAFGLSELQAKKSASTYMAMAKSLGVAEERAASMSMAAAALTGDMSSFFNVSQDVADTAVKSIWTGETESLKQFGVVMTEVNLESYALAKGMGKTYANMSQAEKVTTRYNYVIRDPDQHRTGHQFCYRRDLHPGGPDRGCGCRSGCRFCPVVSEVRGLPAGHRQHAGIHRRKPGSHWLRSGIHLV